MTTTTPINGLPSPDDSSPNDPPIHFVALNNQLDTRLVPRFSSTSARDTAIPTPTTGQAAAVNGLLNFRSGFGWYQIGGTTTLVATLGSTGASGALTAGPHAARSINIPSHSPGRLHMTCTAVWSASATAAGSFSLQTPAGTDVEGSVVRSKNDGAGGVAIGISLQGYYWSSGAARTLYLSVNVEANSQPITVDECAFSVWLV